LDEDVLITGKILLLIAGVTGPIAFCLWYFQIRGRSLFPPQRHRSVPWTGWQISLAVFSVFLLCPVLASRFVSAVSSEAPNDDQIGALTLAGARRELCAELAGFPLQVASILFICIALAGGRPYQLGLVGKGAARWFVLGWLFWLAVTPPALAINSLAEWAYEGVLQTSPEKHPIELIGHLPLQLSDWLLVFVVAVLLAPILEELLFRGVLQPWFATRRRGGDIAIAASCFLVLLLRGKKIGSACLALVLGSNGRPAWSHEAWKEMVIEAIPLLFVLLSYPVYHLAGRLFARRSLRPETIRGIFGTSMLFAMLHASVWPTPIPLLFLALCLGYLAYRTQSVIPGIILHSLFNSVATLQLVLSWANAANGNS
jgi:membrane protease YdiL (CAAX protease family)